MKTIHTFGYERYDSLGQLTPNDRQLVDQARLAAQTANAPYSHFHVGAAARLKSGAIICGSNFESEVYPAGLCAERSLLFHAFACHGGDPIVALAIASQPDACECYPCGQCRQVLLDAERHQQSPIRVIMSGRDSATVVESAALLLPFTFSLEQSNGAKKP